MSNKKIGGSPPSPRASTTSETPIDQKTGTARGGRSVTLKAGFKKVGKAIAAPVKELYSRTIGKGIKGANRAGARYALQSNIEVIRRNLDTGYISKDTPEGQALAQLLNAVEKAIKDRGVSTVRDAKDRQGVIQTALDAAINVTPERVTPESVGNKIGELRGKSQAKFDRAYERQEAIRKEVSQIQDTDKREVLNAEYRTLRKEIYSLTQLISKLDSYIASFETGVSRDQLKQINEEVDAMIKREAKPPKKVTFAEALEEPVQNKELNPEMEAKIPEKIDRNLTILHLNSTIRTKIKELEENLKTYGDSINFRHVNAMSPKEGEAMSIMSNIARLKEYKEKLKATPRPSDEELKGIKEFVNTLSPKKTPPTVSPWLQSLEEHKSKPLPPLPTTSTQAAPSDTQPSLRLQVLTEETEILMKKTIYERTDEDELAIQKNLIKMRDLAVEANPTPTLTRRRFPPPPLRPARASSKPLTSSPPSTASGLQPSSDVSANEARGKRIAGLKEGLSKLQKQQRAEYHALPTLVDNSGNHIRNQIYREARRGFEKTLDNNNVQDTKLDEIDAFIKKHLTTAPPAPRELKMYTKPVPNLEALNKQIAFLYNNNRDSEIPNLIDEIKSILKGFNDNGERIAIPQSIPQSYETEILELYRNQK